ncbi:sigma 54-interacting transcriptional regulator [Dichotomicrobium thermohalophilum]|uniref:Regulatory Fis family protein n=1 Tax=Dichotomicrobium thermohalophilum TaxID=933063 RepID=A0A397QBG1_9HYPH|nr:sigma 54-interacting transcriptional regulator [Dichotomicrobium thermohalophilum]RIA55551.1 regulatory Fis family protein [Dichotomicrobium thermohalophilum]
MRGGTKMQWRTFIYRNAAMAELVVQAKKAARGSANILIEGAPGTGKAALARFIHGCAEGAGELTSVYCAAGEDPAQALAAHAETGGTLLLHDVAELSAPAQAELAMALRRKSRAWIIAASARSLSDAVEAGTFRADVYYRLAVVTLQVPPLAERPEDIPVLAAHFAKRFAQAHGISPRPLAADARDKLAGYAWPGNVRELENVMQRAVLFAEGEAIRAEDVNLLAAPAGEGDPLSAALVGRTVADVERELILQTLRHCGGNRTQAAEILGISVRTLRNKIRQYHEEGAEVPAFSRAA